MKQSKLENAVEVIGQAIHDFMGLSSENPEDKGAIENVNSLISLAESSYILVKWPNSQKYMERKWFDKEAILALGSEDKTGSSAYFIPFKYIINE